MLKRKFKDIKEIQTEQAVQARAMSTAGCWKQLCQWHRKHDGAKCCNREKAK